MKKYFEENKLTELPMVELGDGLKDVSWTLYGNMICHDVKRDVREDVLELFKSAGLNTAYVALYMIGVCEAILSKLEPDVVEMAGERVSRDLKTINDHAGASTGEFPIGEVSHAD